jgi:NAD(P)-dependent dehydrogenase (short-subunit alcohol dehydrogenase family)
VHYCAAKAALKGFTEALAKEVGRYGVTVNCIAPGILETGVSANVPAGRQDEYLRHCALRRNGTLEEIAEVVAFLVSDRNSYMNGSTVLLDGGV